MSAPSTSLAVETRTPFSRLRATVIVLVLLALSGYVDWATGFEVSVFLLYTVPVGLATRWLGPTAAMVSALAATGIWVWADIQSGHLYSQHWFLYINAFNRFACFALTVLAVSYLSAKYQRMSAKVQAFTGEIPECTQCHRIGAADGYWRSLEQHLAEFGGAQLRHKVCPDCARRGYARAAYGGEAAPGNAPLDAEQAHHSC